MIGGDGLPGNTARVQGRIMAAMARIDDDPDRIAAVDDIHAVERQSRIHTLGAADADGRHAVIGELERSQPARIAKVDGAEVVRDRRSEEHTPELQSLMRISYAVFCLQNT